MKYTMFWYFRDQLLMVGRQDLYYLNQDMSAFANGATENPDTVEIRGLIRSICHPELGAIDALITIPLDYIIVLANGFKITVNAEEPSGQMYICDTSVYGWTFDVEVDVIEKTGRTWGHKSRKQSYEIYLEKKEYEAKLKTEIHSRYGIEVDW